MDDDAPDLGSLLERVAAELGDTSTERLGAEIEYSRGGRPFAATSGGAVEIRLDPDVADAVLRTPDTQPSARGEGWIRLAPGQVDRFVADRAESWFRSAWRLAEDR